MKAIVLTAYGTTDNLKVETTVPMPEAKPGHILAQVRAASINPFDSALLSGAYQKMIPVKTPFTIGGDFAGVITGVGDGITGFSLGDEIYGTAQVVGGGSGAMAEYLSTKSGSIAHKPHTIDFIEAASLPLVGSSAIQAIVEHIALGKNQKILIHGGAGGIGSIAIQLAKSIGAYVATTVSTKDADFAKKLGADLVIDFTKEQFETKLSGYDAVYDTVGGKVTDASFEVLKKGGILVSMKGAPNAELAAKYGIRSVGQNTKTNTEHLTMLTKYVESGTITPHVDRVFPFAEAAAAYSYKATGHPRGKVVVRIQ